MTQTVLVMNSISNNHKYAIRLVLKDEAELEAVEKVLKPLGYRFRFPER